MLGHYYPMYVAGGEGSEEGVLTSEGHPPHIHEIDVQCAKDQMTINLEFNTPFDGVIYSKGFYSQPACRYVQPGSGQSKYSFTVRLDSCGTQFIERFKEEGQAYLENVLVLQNEPGIQEVWDTVRRVRCLWEGSLNKALSVALSVGMLREEAVTFSGDTALARLDIQMGRGPFAPAANGLVKIGETMTLVVSVEGDPGFDIQVRDCVARDSTSTNLVQLTDERGCVIKKKLFGAFQKTRETGSAQTSIIAYAFFQELPIGRAFSGLLDQEYSPERINILSCQDSPTKRTILIGGTPSRLLGQEHPPDRGESSCPVTTAFKFPDIMDLTIDCNVELCKTDCEICPDPNQVKKLLIPKHYKQRLHLSFPHSLDPVARRKRDLWMPSNDTLGEPMRIVKTFRVVSAEDLVSPGLAAVINVDSGYPGVCMSFSSFLSAVILLLSLLLGSCLLSAALWLKQHGSTVRLKA
uniref:ZP domain-containing protein n=1 Tax=Timema douglasi TaxID=61478 RepID=A0A7R8Z9B5_TIMDO|nr:unnamed protein product [Timema douglasi]